MGNIWVYTTCFFALMFAYAWMRGTIWLKRLNELEAEKEYRAPLKGDSNE